MTALYIILGILLFLLVLLLLPVKIRLEYDNDLKLWVGYTFIYIQLVPKKPKKPRVDTGDNLTLYVIELISSGTIGVYATIKSMKKKNVLMLNK